MTSYGETLDTIKTRMLGNISDSVDKTEGYLVYDNVVAVGKEVEKISTELDDIAKKFDISNLTGDELAARIEQRTGQTRHLATYATGTLTITGNANIKIGDLFQTANVIQFKSLEAKTITVSGTVNVQAVVAGSSGNIPVNQITFMPITISGVTSVTNNASTIDGYDEETDSAYLERYYEKIQTPSTLGNVAYFKSLVKDYTGVGDAKVFPTWNGNNTIKLVIADANKQPPSSDLVDEVQEYMDPLGDTWGLGYGAAPFGAFTTISGAAGKSINVSFTAVKNTSFNDAQIQASVEANLTTYLKSIAFISSFVSYAQIGALILKSDGILDYSNLTINTGTANIPILDTEVPIKGVVTIV